MELITELFDGASAPVVNLNPKHKIPQILLFKPAKKACFLDLDFVHTPLAVIQIKTLSQATK